MFGDANGSCVGCDYESSQFNQAYGLDAPCDHCFNYGLYKSSGLNTCVYYGDCNKPVLDCQEDSPHFVCKFRVLRKRLIHPT